MHCRTFNSIPGFYQPEANSPLWSGQPEMSLGITTVPLRAKCMPG